MKRLFLMLALVLASVACFAKDDVIETAKGKICGYVISLDGATVLYSNDNMDDVRLPLSSVVSIKIEGSYVIEVKEGLVLNPNDIYAIRQSIKDAAAAEKAAKRAEIKAAASDFVARVKANHEAAESQRRANRDSSMTRLRSGNISFAPVNYSVEDKGDHVREKSSFLSAVPHCTSHEGLYDVALMLGVNSYDFSWSILGSYGFTDRAIGAVDFSFYRNRGYSTDYYLAICPMYMLDGVPSYNGGMAYYAGIDVGFAGIVYDEMQHDWETDKYYKHSEMFILGPSFMLKWQMTDRLFVGGKIMYSIVPDSDGDKYIRGGFVIGWQFR